MTREFVPDSDQKLPPETFTTYGLAGYTQGSEEDDTEEDSGPAAPGPTVLRPTSTDIPVLDPEMMSTDQLMQAVLNAGSQSNSDDAVGGTK